MSKLLAFLKKDLLIESSYKISFIFNMAAVVITISSYFFIDRLFNHKIADHLQEFGTGYFSYVIVSMALFGYIGTGLSSLSSRIRSEQIQGTLEGILLTPTKLWMIIIAMSLWNIVMATLDLMIYILLGTIIFKIDFTTINLISSLTVLLLTIISFGSIGIISAAFIMVFKRGNPFAWFMGSIQGFLGGVYFPATILPAWMQTFSKLLPVTYSIRAIELSVYKGYSINQLKSELIPLGLFALFLLPFSLKFFGYALKKAKIEGSLLQY